MSTTDVMNKSLKYINIVNTKKQNKNKKLHKPPSSSKNGFIESLAVASSSSSNGFCPTASLDWSSSIKGLPVSPTASLSPLSSNGLLEAEFLAGLGGDDFYKFKNKNTRKIFQKQAKIQGR